MLLTATSPYRTAVYQGEVLRADSCLYLVVELRRVQQLLVVL